MNNLKIIELSPLSKLDNEKLIPREFSRTKMQYIYDLFHYQNKSIAIADIKTTEIIPITSIIYIQSSSNYSTIYLLDGRIKITSKTLKHWQNKIDDKHFLRCHNSYLINSKHVKSIDSNQSHLVISDVVLPISRSKKNMLLDFFA